MDDDAVDLCVHGESLWHRLGLSALGVGWEERDGVARRSADVSEVYLGAMTLSRRTTAEQLDAAVAGLGGRVHVCDSYDVLDMGPLGWSFAVIQPWMMREPPHRPAPGPPGVSVEPVRTEEDVVTFERTIFEAADGNPDWAPRGSVHPAPASLHLPGMTLLLARLDGEPVGTAFGAVDERVVQIGAVSVLPRARRRGIGAALAAAAAALGPDRPAVLSSTRVGHGVYLGLGFRDGGGRALWVRGPSRAD